MVPMAVKRPPNAGGNAYYQHNSAKISASRRVRYGTDKGYRERVLSDNARYRRRQKQTEPATERSTSKGWREQTFEIDGKPVVMVSVGGLSKFLGRSQSRISQWITDGKLREADYVTPHGDRYYRASTLEQIRESLETAGCLGASGRRRDVAFTPYVRKVRYADGREESVALYRVGMLARAIGRTPVAVTAMEKAGTLPVGTLRGGRTIKADEDANAPSARARLGYRLYTLPQIEAAARVSKSFGARLRDTADKTRFRERVEAEWTALGVLTAVVVEDGDGRSDESVVEAEGRGRAIRRHEPAAATGGSGAGVGDG